MYVANAVPVTPRDTRGARFFLNRLVVDFADRLGLMWRNTGLRGRSGGVGNGRFRVVFCGGGVVILKVNSVYRKRVNTRRQLCGLVAIELGVR